MTAHRFVAPTLAAMSSHSHSRGRAATRRRPIRRPRERVGVSGAHAPRIIAGTLRGRALRCPPGRDVRPTGLRQREALFSILGDLTDLAVIDAFAGTGALGLEAYSRGARPVVLVERHGATLAHLEASLCAWHLEDAEGLRAMRADVVTLLPNGGLPEAPFALALLDPPYPSLTDPDFLAALDAWLAQPGLLAADGRVVLGHPSDFDPPTRLGGAPLVDRRVYGRPAFAFYSPTPDPAPS